jgi:hypothetical protein
VKKATCPESDVIVRPKSLAQFGPVGKKVVDAIQMMTRAEANVAGAMSKGAKEQRLFRIRFVG